MLPTLLVLGFVLLLYLGVVVLLVRLTLWPPRVPVFCSPQFMSAPQETIEFSSEDGIRLRAWWVEAPSPKVIVVFAHGFLMNRSEFVPFQWRLWRKGVSSLTFDSRAHGGSQATQCTLGWKESRDVLAALDWVRARHPGVPVVLFGSSMGGAACCLAVGQRPEAVDGLILDGAYRNLSEAASGFLRMHGGWPLAHAMWPAKLLGSLLMRRRLDRIETPDALRRFAGKPVLLLLSELDTVVPLASAERMTEAAGPSARAVVFPGCHHSMARLYRAEDYTREVETFLARWEPSLGPSQAVAGDSPHD